MAEAQKSSDGAGLIAGFAETVILSALMLMKRATGLMPQVDVTGMLAGMLRAGAAVAWLVHFLVGTAGYGIAIALLSPEIASDAIAVGLTPGAGGWLIMMIVFMSMAGNGCSAWASNRGAGDDADSASDLRRGLFGWGVARSSNLSRGRRPPVAGRRIISLVFSRFR